MRGKRFFACSTAITLSVATAMPSAAVFAAENNNILDEAALASCLSALEANVCQLGSDIVVANNLTVPAGADTTLDLHGHNITVGTFTGAVNRGIITVENGGALKVISQNDSGEAVDGKITTEGSDVYAAIRMTTNSPEPDATKTAKLTVEDGVTLEGHYYAIVGNGSRHNTEITVNGGTIKGLNTDEDSNLGIFHPQDGKLTVNGGTIIGETGIEMRAGELIVNGGTIKGTGTPTSVNPNGSGSTTEGAGIAIAQHTTLKDIKVTINDGAVEGFSAVYESNPQGNANVEEQVSIAINGGDFKAVNGGTLAVYSADSTVDNGLLTVSGGKFNTQLGNFTIGEGTNIYYDINTGTYEVKELVDLTEINEAITEADEITEASKYSVLSWNNFQAALAAAKTARTEATGGSKDAMQTYINEKTNNLNKAIAELVDLSGLRVAIAEAQEFVLENGEKYTEASVARYNELIDSAISTRDDEDLVGESGQQAVTSAIDNLVLNRRLETEGGSMEYKVNKSRLEFAVEMVSQSIPCDDPDLPCVVIKEGSVLDNLYTEAKEALEADLGTSDQEDVDRLFSDLFTALITKIGNDEAREMALEAMSKVDELDEELYTKKSYSKVTEAYEKVTAFMAEHADEDDSKEAYFEEFAELIEELESTIDELVEAADTEALKIAIEKAEAIDEAVYTEESVADLEAALEAAKVVLGLDATFEEQDIIDEATKALEDALEALVKIEIPDTGTMTNTDGATAGRDFTGLIATVCVGVALAIASLVKSKFTKKNR